MLEQPPAQLQEQLRKFSRYEALAGPSILQRWRALRYSRDELDEDEHQLLMALDVFERATNLERFVNTSTDLLQAISNLNVPHTSPYCDDCGESELCTLLQLDLVCRRCFGVNVYAILEGV